MMYLLEKNYYVPYEQDDTELLCVSSNRKLLMARAKSLAVSEYGHLFKEATFFDEGDRTYIERSINGADITFSVSKIEEI